MASARGLMILLCLAFTSGIEAFAFSPSSSAARCFAGNLPRAQYAASWATGCRGLSMKKGFGPERPKKVKKPKTEGSKKREVAASDYDKMAAAGIPEYNIFIKPKGTSDYLPCGVMTVPRSTQVSQAVFEQEENLKQSAFRLYDKLRKVEEFEYGYNLKIYPDDPVTPLEKRAPSANPITRFFEGLMSPVNTQGMKGPPIN